MMHKKWNLEPEAVGDKIRSDWAGVWLVMRCSNADTMPLVLALADIDVQAWTPLWLRRRRYPRSSCTRKVVLPCLPSFAFLAEPDIDKALDAAERYGVPGFSLMDNYGVLVRIADHELESLRKVADMNPRASNPVKWPAVGERQRITAGAFQGLSGVVVGHTKRHCLVKVDGSPFPAFKIPPFLLSRIEA